MKINKIWKYSLAIFSATSLVALPTSFALISCSSNTNSEDTTNIDNNVKSNLINYVNNNHGRWTGNLSNYDTNNINIQKFGTTDIDIPVGLKSEDVEPKYNLNTSINSDINNYGSYHAYLYILNQINNFLNTNQSFVVNWPTQANITNFSAEPNQPIATITPSDNSFSVSLGDKNNTATSTNVAPGYIKSIIMNGDASTGDVDVINKLKENKLNVVTQGFLWNGVDRASSGYMTFNNRGQNIITTIPTTNPDIKNPKDFYIVAHYDSTASGTNKSSWGASDNGTGVAVALSLIQYYANSNNSAKLPVNLRIVFSDAEEVGVLGTNALVEGVISKDVVLKSNIAGMINLDTVAGGDNLYVHSPDTKHAEQNYNVSSSIRDQLNSISSINAKTNNDPSLELQIHPQVSYTDDDFLPGETGDWSDHAPFYQKLGVEVAYIESTNFQVLSHSGIYDGYAQTYNPNAWLDKNGNPVNLNKENINGTSLEVWNLPQGMVPSDFMVMGDIWHSDLDTLSWYNQYFGNKIYKQISTVFNTLITYLETLSNPNSNTLIYKNGEFEYLHPCDDSNTSIALQNAYLNWYNSLSDHNWNEENNKYLNYYCDSEQQAIGLYAWNGGTWWNEPLHRGYEPINLSLILKNMDKNIPHEIRGIDYKYMVSGLAKAELPWDQITWHGVEYMEVEWYEQLKDYIILNQDGTYNYTNCIGKNIQSHGFLSTTLKKEYATNFFDWRPSYEWNTDLEFKPPLKEKVAFKIHMKKGYKGAAYLGTFDFAGFNEICHMQSSEQQILINKGACFHINNVWKENINNNIVNIFDVTLF